MENEDVGKLLNTPADWFHEAHSSRPWGNADSFLFDDKGDIDDLSGNARMPTECNRPGETREPVRRTLEVEAERLPDSDPPTTPDRMGERSVNREQLGDLAGTADHRRDDIRRPVERKSYVLRRKVAAGTS